MKIIQEIECKGFTIKITQDLDLNKIELNRYAIEKWNYLTQHAFGYAQEEAYRKVVKYFEENYPLTE